MSAASAAVQVEGADVRRIVVLGGQGPGAGQVEFAACGGHDRDRGAGPGGEEVLELGGRRAGGRGGGDEDAGDPGVAAVLDQPGGPQVVVVAVGQGLALVSRIPGPESTPSAALNLDLLRCTALEFDAELNPLRPITVDDVSRALRCGWEAAVREHAAAENYDTAGAALEVFELHGGRAETIGKPREEHHRRRRTSRQEVESLHRDVTHRAETAARLGQLPEPGRSRVIARLEASTHAQGVPQLPLAGEPVIADWDPGLAPSMTALGIALHEEATLDLLVKDLS
ncbi:DUF2399 domain-containing protein [Streptomyces sp. NPDC002917]|uniref:DUF2399 domain-containing protein n=1 Tax=Streptomyces sp. NPDC002917 TaxID=3364671 RepID=UPI0036A1D369